MRTLAHLFSNNRAWAARISGQDPEFFNKLSKQQAPQYLWIGCSDSRVPANQVVDLLPGELFVHRNIANLALHGDLNCMSVVQFAVDVLKVRHIIVCGHYGCGGVQAALRGDDLGLCDKWLHHLRDVRNKYHAYLQGLASDEQRLAQLCEINVVEQAYSVATCAAVRSAWARGQPLAVHGWIYAIGDGLLRDLGMTAESESEAGELHQAAVLRFR